MVSFLGRYFCTEVSYFMYYDIFVMGVLFIVYVR